MIWFIRVGVSYDGNKKPLNFSSDLRKKDIISKATSLFQIPNSDADFFQLKIQDLDCKINDADSLLNNDTLLLSKREMVWSDEDEEILAGIYLIKLSPLTLV